MTDQLPPNDLSAEQAVIGCILLAGDRIQGFPTPEELIDDCQATLKTDAGAFYDLKCRTLFNTLSEMRDEREPIDVLTLTHRLRAKNQLDACGGLALITTLPDSVPCVSNLPYYLKLIAEKYQSRQVLSVCAEAVQDSYTQPPAEVINDVETKISNLEVTTKATIFDGKEAALIAADDLERRFQLQGARSGLTTGFSGFDRLTDGLQFGDQTIIASRPSVGKSAMAMNCVERICLTDNIATLFVTLEMSPAALCKRLLASSRRITMNDIRAGRFTEGNFRSFTGFNIALRKSGFYIINAVGGIDIGSLCAQVRRMVRKLGIKFVIIDYLQKVRPSLRQEKRTYEVGEVSTSIRALAVETGAAFLTLAQLNRESDKDKGRLPRLADLADSGQIERDADCVALLHRSRENPSESKLIIAKQRDGETGVVELFFNGAYCRFENVTHQETSE